MSRTSRSRSVALGLFWFLVLAGTVYYWFTPTLQLRPERRIMWTHAMEWWQGMSGRLLAQHREGLQVAQLDPATGRVLAVQDLRTDVGAIRRVLADLAPGHWLIITALELGGPDTSAALADLLRGAGWSGPVEAINQGGGILVLGRSRQSGRLFEVASHFNVQPPVTLTLPVGMRGPDGSRLGRSLSILVRPYD